MSFTSRKFFVLFAVIIGIVLMVGFSVLNGDSDSDKKLQKEALFSLGFFHFDKPRAVKDVAMVNLNGETQPFSQHMEGWRLVNFGYMFCPDICPINLSLLSDVKTQWDVDKESEGLQDLGIVHVTFDPARDTPQLLRNYLNYMNPDFYGVTGELGNIRVLAQQFNMVFIHEKPDNEGHYFITHSDSMALVNPKGQYVGMFKGPYQKDNMLAALKLLMN